jgi:hypothetical protein
VRFEREAAALGRRYDVYAFRIDAPERRRVAVLFRDITAPKRSDDRTACSRRRRTIARRTCCP